MKCLKNQVSKATDEPTSASKPMKHDNTEANTLKATETSSEEQEKDSQEKKEESLPVAMTTRINANVVHHQVVEPKVAHAQAHDFSHSQAVSQEAIPKKKGIFLALTPEL